MDLLNGARRERERGREGEREMVCAQYNTQDIMKAYFQIFSFATTFSSFVHPDQTDMRAGALCLLARTAREREREREICKNEYENTARLLGIPFWIPSGPRDSRKGTIRTVLNPRDPAQKLPSAATVPGNALRNGLAVPAFNLIGVEGFQCFLDDVEDSKHF